MAELARRTQLLEIGRLGMAIDVNTALFTRLTYGCEPMSLTYDQANEVIDYLTGEELRHAGAH